MQSTIEQKVMASVGTVYVARQLISLTALKLYVCALALLGLWKLVWITRVYEKLAHVGVGGAFNFMLAAVANTDFLVQITLVALVVAGLSLAREVVRTLSTPRTFAA